MFDKAKSFFGKLGPVPKILIILAIMGIVLYVANTIIDFNSSGVSSDSGKSSVTATEEDKPVKKSRGKQTTFYE